jgi:hypothetical protein
MIRIASCEPEHVEQLATLLSAHAACALPGAAIAPGTIARRLERDPSEFVVDPWVDTRETLVAIGHDRVVAAGQLWRFGDEPRVSEDFRGAAELRWFCFWPTDHEAAGALLDHAIEHAGPVRRFYLAGDLPEVLVHGIPDAWTHVVTLASERGFAHDGRTEVLLAGRLLALAGTETPPAGCTLRTGVAWSGDALLIAERADAPLAQMELAVEGRAGQLWGPFAQDGEVERDVARWLWLEAFEWLRLAGCDRVVAGLVEDEPEVEQAVALGLRQVTRLLRGWTLRPEERC